MKSCWTIFLLLLPLPAAGQNVVINEIGWMGTIASTSDEWIELYNPTPHAIDLQGWSLKAADGIPAIRLTGVIPAQGYYVLERTDDQTISDRPAEQLFTGDLKNSGEWLILRSSDSLLVDQVRCDSSGWFAGTNNPKRSMERRHPLLSGMLPESWADNDTLTRNGLDAAGHPLSGTPGAPNSVYDHTLPVGQSSRRLPKTEELLWAWPNPFNPGIMLAWGARSEEGTVEILDLLGRLVRSWPSPPAARGGRAQLFWDGCDAAGRPVATGTYICRLRRGRTIAAQLRLTRCR